MTLPNWNCQSDRERQRFEDWTNNQLDLRLAEELGKHAGQDLKDMGSLSLDTNRAILEELLDAAIKSHDPERVESLLCSKPYRTIVAQRLTHSKGRPPFPNAKLELLRQSAREHVRLVREIWKKNYSKQNRSYRNPPTAEDIIMRRFAEIGRPLKPRDLGLKIPPK